MQGLIVGKSLDELLLDFGEVVVDDLFGFGGVKFNKGLYLLHENVTKFFFVLHDFLEFLFLSGIPLLDNDFFKQVLQELKDPDSEIRPGPEININSVIVLFVHAADFRLQVHQVIQPGSFINGDESVVDKLRIFIVKQC